MALLTTKEIRSRFNTWANSWLSENNLVRAYNDGDEKKIRQQAEAKLTPKQASALLAHLFPEYRSKSMHVIIALSNAGRKRRNRQRAEDKITGDRLSTDPSKVTDEYAASKLKDAILDDTGALASESRDVIFIPQTQTTRYSACHSAKFNLERRMPGYEIHAEYGGGEGILSFTAKAELVVQCGDSAPVVCVTAHCVASPSDMAVHRIEIAYEDTQGAIEPATVSRSPEQAVDFIQRVVQNFVCNKQGV